MPAPATMQLKQYRRPRTGGHPLVGGGDWQHTRCGASHHSGPTVHVGKIRGWDTTRGCTVREPRRAGRWLGRAV